mgnify:CR=1 FL=1
MYPFSDAERKDDIKLWLYHVKKHITGQTVVALKKGVEKHQVISSRHVNLKL